MLTNDEKSRTCPHCGVVMFSRLVKFCEHVSRCGGRK